MNCKRIGMDIAKNVFVLHGVDKGEREMLKKKLKRTQVLEYFAKLPVCEVVMEACGSAHYWGRELSKFGHTVKLIAPQHVKPFIPNGKNDANDAKGICEASSRPSMRYVAIKSEEQQALQSILRIRDGLIKDRTALANRVRGLLSEFGVICSVKGIACTRRRLHEVLGDEASELPTLFRQGLWMLEQQLSQLDAQIQQIDQMIKTHSAQNETVQRLMKIEGIGIVIANAVVASVTDAHLYANARMFAASLGLTPKQHSSGGKDKLGSISKQGDGYLRYLLIHGARTVVQYCLNKNDERSLWIQGLLLRKHKNVVTVALANKMARIIWAMLTRGEDYRPPKLVLLESDVAVA